MKKILLGTTALVAASLIAGQAMAAEKPSVKVGGFTQWNFFSSTNSNASGEHSLTADDSEVTIKASGKADNGLGYGAKIELEGDVNANGNSDETVMWVSGSWGKIEIGSEDGAADRLAVTTPSGWGDGGANGDYDDVSGESFKGLDWDGSETGDANKITYFGSAGAVSFGASFVPDSKDEGADSQDGGGYNSSIELGAKYSGESGGMKFTVGAAGAFGSSDDTTKEDLSAYQIGASVSSGGWTVGGHYVDNGDSGKALASGIEEDLWAVGAQYKTGPWTVGAHYVNAEGGAAAADDNTVISAGFTYAVAPGLSVGGEVTAWDETVGGTSADGEVFTLLTAVKF